MKIGLNYEKNTSGTDYNYMLVRHVPMNKDLFGFYVKDAFTNFDRIPTWKRTSPHNIQRKTWQNTDCNNCHVKRELFLSLTDILQNEITANASVIVPDDRVPHKTDRPDPCPAELGLVKQDRIIQKEWLYQHLSSTDLVIIDARTNEEYGKGHIKGAIHFDALLADGGVRWPWHAPKPAHLKGPDLLSKILGSIGIRNDRHIIVYDKDGWRSGFLLAVLEYAGAGHISFLEGGIQAWKEAGYTVSYDDIKSEPAAFVVKAHPEFLVDNAYVKNNQYNPGVIIADVRSLDHSNALTKHEQAISKGRIPGSVKFPFTSLYMDNAELKSPGELLFVLRTKGITPDKTIVLTSETGARAGSVFFILRYLGYPDVRIHEASWVGWCDENCDPAD